MLNTWYALTAGAIITSASCALAQEGPNYAETTRFLQEKLNVENNHSWQSVSFPERCVFKKERFDKTSPEYRHIFSVHLSKMDPSKVYSRTDVGGGYVYFVTLKNLWVANATTYKNGKVFKQSTTNSINLAPILDPDTENGPRVVKALSHLINLCGGKKELF